jgi:Flp pilus assembly protein TadD
LADRARLALETESAGAAEQWFRRAAEATPFERDVLYGWHQCLAGQGRQAEAAEVQARWRRVEGDYHRLAEVTRAIAATPTDPDLRCEAGSILLRNGQEAAGLRWLESALRLNPRHAAARGELAAHYERAGRPDLAERHRPPNR